MIKNKNKTKILKLNFVFNLFSFNSGSSSGSGGSIPHSFSVDEIQKMRVKLKSSKSYPNDLIRQESEQMNEKNESTDAKLNENKNVQTIKSVHQKDKLSAIHDECDNSSSGVSSDQEITSNNKTIIKTSSNSIIITTKEQTNIKPNAENNNINKNKLQQQQHGILKTNNSSNATANSNVIESINKKSINLPPLSNTTKKISAAIADDTKNANDDFDEPPSPPLKGFQRHNSLTRKQAATIAINRALYTKSAVSLVQLPPPIEADSDETDQTHYHAAEYQKNNRNIERTRAPICDKNRNDEQDIVLAPPPEFSDSVCTNSTVTKCNNATTTTGTSNASGRNVSVRIVGAVPKTSRLQSH